MCEKPSVVVVDDEPDALDVVVRTLLPKFEVATFSSPEQALVAVTGEQPAVMVVDHKMPRMNGFELGLRVREAGLTCPVIMVTAFPELVQVLLKDRPDPFFRVLGKPFRPAELLATVEEALRAGPVKPA